MVKGRKKVEERKMTKKENERGGLHKDMRKYRYRKVRKLNKEKQEPKMQERKIKKKVTKNKNIK